MSKKNGRPKKPAGDVKAGFLRVRVTPLQKRALKYAADQAGLDVSSWLRSVGLKAAEGA